jgi:hypothetical protein
MALALAEKRWVLGQVKSWQMMMDRSVIHRSLSLTAGGVIRLSVLSLLWLTDAQAFVAKLSGLLHAGWKWEWKWKWKL